MTALSGLMSVSSSGRFHPKRPFLPMGRVVALLAACQSGCWPSSGQVGEGAVSEHVLEASAGAAHVGGGGDGDGDAGLGEVGQERGGGALPVDDEAGGLFPDLVDEVDGPHGAVVVGVPVFGEFDVGGVVVVSHACADGQACALGVHVDAEAHDAAGAAALDGGFLPLAAVDGLAEGVFVPDAEGFAPEVVAGEVFPQVGDGFVAGVGRVAGVGFPPLVAVEGVGVAVCGEFDVEGAVGAARARFVPEAGERFAVVPWPGRGAHVDGLGVPGAVLGRQHRRHRRVGQVLGPRR